METKSKQRNVRFPKPPKSDVENYPRISGKRTGNDKEFLKSNNGKLSILASKI